MICPACGREVRDQFNFCNFCGQPMRAVRPAAPQPIQQPAPQPVQQAAPQPVQQPAPQPIQQAAPQPIQPPAPQPVQQPAPQPIQQAAPQPIQQPAPQPVQQAAPQPVQQPAPQPIQQVAPQTATAASNREDAYKNERTTSGFYLFDFFISIVRKGNIGVLIWMIINTALVTCLFGFGLLYSFPFFQYDYPWLAFVIGFLIYFVSIMIALSPVGETILRLQAGCKKIKRQDYLARLTPLFNEVYQKAKLRNPHLPDNIRFYMSNDSEPNAFATGRRTVCITEGLLQLPDEEIKAILGHEFGHLAHKDTDAILVVEVGNLIVTAIFVIFRFIVNAFTFLMHITIALVSNSLAEIIISALSRILIDFLLTLIMTVWTKLGVLICLSSSRKNEYEADAYSVSLGYGYQLCAALDKLNGFSRGAKSSLWATLNSTHPDTQDRIARMQQLGVNYSRF